MRIILAFMLAIGLSACASLPNTLAPDQVASFRLGPVTVSVPDSSTIAWSQGEAAYAATLGVPAHAASELSSTPEARAYVRAAIAGKMREAFERALAPRLTGTRPVKVDVLVKVVTVPSALQRILVGGNPSLLADVTLQDAKTGAVLIVYRDQVASVTGGEGLVQTLVVDVAFSPAMDRLTEEYATRYGRWLTRS